MPERPHRSLPPSYFEALYREYEDPWSFATSDYERAKYDVTLAALPRARYRSAFEIGCSVGVLTARLAERCDALLSVDVSEAALERARQHCAGLRHVSFARLCVPDAFPQRSFDLIVLSEVGYYWSLADLERARVLIADHLEPGGHLLLVHWTPVVADYPLTGNEVHRRFLASAGPGNALEHRGGRREASYRLDLFERRADPAP